MAAIKNICNLGKDFDQISNCVIGAVKDLVWSFRDLNQGKQFCNLFDNDLQKVCLKVADDYYKTF